MASSIDAFIRDIRKFDGRKEVMRNLRRELRKPLPGVRVAIRARALATMPHRGGLAAWVARERVTAVIRLAGRRAGVKVKGSRKTPKGKADLRRLDDGRVRHPSWGRRSPGDWHTQAVPPHYFTDPALEFDQWRDAAERAFDDALEVIRRG